MLLPTTEIALDQASVTMMAVVLASPAMAPVVERRLSRRPGLWSVRISHNPVSAMAELAMLQRDYDGARTSHPDAQSDGATARRRACIVLIFALPDAESLFRDMSAAIARYLPGVCAITLDAESLELLEKNSLLFVSCAASMAPRASVYDHSQEADYRESGQAIEESMEMPDEQDESADSIDEEPLSISREELTMLLQESAPAGAADGPCLNGGRHD